jgi:hypothetical protein
MKPIQVPHNHRAHAALSGIGQHPLVGPPRLPAGRRGVVIEVFDWSPAIVVAQPEAVLTLAGYAELFARPVFADPEVNGCVHV